MSERAYWPEYLGDGVYASFDGYQIWLRAGHQQIALDPAVIEALSRYVQTLRVQHTTAASTVEL